jgi:signal transduction histidine kinase
MPRTTGRKHAKPSARALIAAFAAVAGSFLLATLLSEYSDVKIRRDAAHITNNAAPSIVHLEAFRSEARRLVVLADDYVDQTAERGSPDARTDPRAPLAALSSSLATLNGEWSIYRSLPTFRGEGELVTVVAGVKDRFVTDLRRTLEAARVGNALSALDLLEHRVKPGADALDDATVKLVDLNAGEATRLGSRIDGLGKRSIRLAVGLDGLSVLLTILAAFLVYRFMRRYTRLVEDRAEELELFAGRVAHDVLSPFGAANLALSYLAEKLTLEDPRARRMLMLGQRSIARTRLIADDLLEFASAGARPDPAARADVRLVVTAVIEEARGLADERQITLSVDGVDVGPVRCSQGILSSLVSNLVRNAVKYVGVGPGKLVIIRARRLGKFARIEVEDNGPGLPEALGASVFEPYVRAPGNDQPGIGLGLATVKRITEAHGGRVGVRSVEGGGCRFTFELPGAFDDHPAGARSTHENALPHPEKPPRVGPEDEHQRGTSGGSTGLATDLAAGLADSGSDEPAVERPSEQLLRQDPYPSGHAG